MNTVDLTQWQTARRWWTKNPTPFFKTYAALEWFIRKHRPALIASGEFLIRRGSSGSLVGPGFNGVVLRLLRADTEAYDAATGSHAERGAV
jgi:hypothetical protein